MRLMLLDYGLDIIASQDEKYDFVTGIASGKLDFNLICDWISKNSE